MADISGYELSRNWFDWCYEHPELISPNHSAIYFFAIEHCNRLGWKEKFGMPTQMTMEAIGIKNWRTYSKAFNELVEWGFFKVIEKSRNQYSATVIAIVKNTKANTKALTKATQKHLQKHLQKQRRSKGNSTVVIDKPINLLTIKPNNEGTKKEDQQHFEKLFLNDQTLLEHTCRLTNCTDSGFKEIVKDFFSENKAAKKIWLDLHDCNKHFISWLKYYKPKEQIEVKVKTPKFKMASDD